MEILLIAALTRDRVIGRDGAIPWHYPADLRFFRRVTTGHAVIMGRVTFAALPRRPLPGRANLVLSRQTHPRLEADAVHCRSLEAALGWCRTHGQQRVFVAGGEQVYRAALPLATGMHLTWVPDDVDGDTHFPSFHQSAWEVVDTRRRAGLTFVTYRRAAAR